MASSPISLKVLFSGSCACSRLTYHITSLPTITNACHCITCRKLSGGPFQAYFDIPPSSTTFFDADAPTPSHRYSVDDTIPGLVLDRRSPYATRGRCASCHSWLTMRYHLSAPHTLGICLGSVDDASYAGNRQVSAALRVKQHIFVSQKVPWMAPDWLQAETERGIVHDRFAEEGFEEAMMEAKGK